MLIIAVIAIIIIYFVYVDMNRLHEVAPGLFISSWDDALDERLLRQHGVTRVICVSTLRKTPNELQRYPRVGVDHYQFAISDRTRAPINLIFQRTGELIAGHRTLVHCDTETLGRSATVAAAYLIKKNNISASAAIEQIRQVAPNAWPNAGFRRALDAL